MHIYARICLVKIDRTLPLMCPMKPLVDWCFRLSGHFAFLLQVVPHAGRPHRGVGGAAPVRRQLSGHSCSLVCVFAVPYGTADAATQRAAVNRHSAGYTVSARLLHRSRTLRPAQGKHLRALHALAAAYRGNSGAILGAVAP